MQAQTVREELYSKGIRKGEKDIYDKEDNFFPGIFFFKWNAYQEISL